VTYVRYSACTNNLWTSIGATQVEFFICCALFHAQDFTAMFVVEWCLSVAQL